MDDRVNVPAWNHFPFLGYLHYRNKITMKSLEQPRTILPPLNPYLGFINHSIVNPPVELVQKKDVGTQTDPDKAMELGQQIIDKMGYE
jgi:hypothetical protein